MINIKYFKGKKIAVVGLARSGVACANLLFDLGARVSVTDKQDSSLTRQNAKALKSGKIEVELGAHSPQIIKGKDLVIVSPGVFSNSQPVEWARQEHIPVISEIEAASLLCPAQIIAVTGSNGKTTVTTLIGKIIESRGEKSFVCGNIGTPFSQEVSKMNAQDYAVLEVSSFQLETIRDFKPKIALILNFSPNHLDRHKDMGEYLEAKKRIFMNQDKNDFLVLNYDDPVVRGLAAEAKAKAVYFSKTDKLNPNLAAVLAVGTILGVKEEECAAVFKEFRGAQHRMEIVSRINKINFINDSKATTVESAIWALKSIPGPVILIAGGRDKGLDYRPVLEHARNKVKKVILIGEAKQKIKKALNDELAVSEAETLQEAVRLAYNSAKTGDTILLSPMCASFDMFSDYEERGRVFKETVLALSANKE